MVPHRLSQALEDWGYGVTAKPEKLCFEAFYIIKADLMLHGRPHSC